MRRRSSPPRPIPSARTFEGGENSGPQQPGHAVLRVYVDDPDLVFAAKLIVTSGGTYLGVGSLTSMITYSMQILMSLMMLSMILVMLTMAQASGKRICEVLGETSSLHNPETRFTRFRTALSI